jgi:PIN domain nuclease of toxin-antitoxin system
VRILLDTHVFLWWIANSELLSKQARSLIDDGTNELFFSAASGWEIAIKAGLGKLRLPDNPERFIAEQLTANAIQPLPIHLSHALRVYSLPEHHRDPFDRMLVAQSQLENLVIMTGDPWIAAYDVQVVW